MPPTYPQYPAIPWTHRAAEARLEALKKEIPFGVQCVNCRHSVAFLTPEERTRFLESSGWSERTNGAMSCPVCG